MEELNTIKASFLEKKKDIKTLENIKEIRAEFLGKKSEINNIFKKVVSLSDEEKKVVGTKVNNLRELIVNDLKSIEDKLLEEKVKQELERETIDITLPVRDENIGEVHPLSYVINEMRTLFQTMNFAEATGTEIETDWFNFEGLNTPQNHPARQMQDTFYLNDNSKGEKVVLRTQTTSIELREMSNKNKKPPFKFFVADKVFRREMDSTHSPMFHQLEGVYVNKNVTMQDLKNCLTTFLKKFFGLKEVPLRFRPSYFPFTSPSVEVDIRCKKTDGKLILGEGDDWLEVLGGGMLHPTVLGNANIDPDVYTGFAFGCGIERFAMLKYGIRDIRNLYDGDIRFLKQYGFKAED